MTGTITTLTGMMNFQILICPKLIYSLLRFVDRNMVLRYHWGLSNSHTYSHVRDSISHMAQSVSRASPTSPDGFSDLHNVSISKTLEWWFPDVVKAAASKVDNNYNTKIMAFSPTYANGSTSLIHMFDDLDIDFLLSEVEWGLTVDDGDIDGNDEWDGGSGLDSNSGLDPDALEIYVMYGSNVGESD